MRYPRRKLLKLGLGALPLTRFLANRTSLLTAKATAATPTATKPNSKFNGVQIGIIAPYSFRGLPSTAEVLLHNLVELGISAVELQNDPDERFAGAPAGGGRGDGPGRPGAIPGLSADQPAALTAINESLASKNQAVSAARTALAQAAYSDAAAIQSRLAALMTAELDFGQREGRCHRKTSKLRPAFEHRANQRAHRASRAAAAAGWRTRRTGRRCQSRDDQLARQRVDGQVQGASQNVQ